MGIRAVDDDRASGAHPDQLPRIWRLDPNWTLITIGGVISA